MNAEDFLNGAAPPTVDDHIAEAAQRFGVSPDLIRATMGAESEGDPWAVSNKGAGGLMQVMPGTFADMARQHGLGSDRFDPRTNVLAGTAYLRQMLDRFGGDPQLALAAYNAGPGRVDQHLATGAALPAETRTYVPRVLNRMGGQGAQRSVDPLSLLPADAVLIGGAGADTVGNPFTGMSAEDYLAGGVDKILRGSSPGAEYANAVRDILRSRKEAESRQNAPDPMASLPADAVLLSGPSDPLALLPPDAVILSAEDFLADVKAPPKPAPGVLSTFGTAAARGAGEAIRNTANAPSFSQDRPAEEKAPDGIDDLLTKPIGEGWSDPKWWAAQIGAGIGGSAPSVAAGVAGGAAGSVVGGPAGALVGSALGFGGGSFVQSLAPEYQRARAEGLDHDAAVDRALQQSGIAGAFGAAMGLAPGVGLFGKTAEGAIKRPISEALAQIFGVQPGLGMGQRATQNVAAGRETTAEELLQDYALNAGAGAAMVGAHKGVERMARRGAKPEEGTAPAAEKVAAEEEAAPAVEGAPVEAEASGQSDGMLALPRPAQTRGEGFVMGELPEDRFTPAEAQRREKEAADLDALIERRTREMGFLQEQIPAETSPAERDRKMELFRQKNRQVERARARLDELRPQPIGPQPPEPSRPIGEAAPEDAPRALPAPDLVRGEGFTLGQDSAALASAQEAAERQQRADTLRGAIDKLTGQMGALQEQISRETDVGERRRKTALFRTKSGKLDAARAELDSLEPRAIGPQPPAPSRRIDTAEAPRQGQRPDAPRLALPRPEAAYGEGFTMGNRHPASAPPEPRPAESPTAGRIDLETRRLAALDRRIDSRTREMDELRWQIAQTVDPAERARIADEFRTKVRDLSQTRTQATDMRARLDRMRADAAPPAPGDRVRVTYGRTGETYEATFEGARGPRTLVRRDDGRLFTPISSAHSIERVQQPAPVASAQQRAAQPKAASLFQFLTAKGGIQDQGGELRTKDLHRAFVPGGGKLVRSNGLPLDRARELAEEAGYLRPSDRGDRFGRTDVTDLLDAIDREARGAKVYPLDDTADIASSRAERRQAEEEAYRLDSARQEVAEYTEGAGLHMSADEVDGASRLMIEDGIAADEAVGEMIERSMIAHEAEFAKRQEAIGDEQTIPFEELGGEDRGAGRGPVDDGSAAGRGPAAGTQRSRDGGYPRPEEPAFGEVARADQDRPPARQQPPASELDRLLSDPAMVGAVRASRAMNEETSRSNAQAAGLQKSAGVSEDEWAAYNRYQMLGKGEPPSADLERRIRDYRDRQDEADRAQGPVESDRDRRKRFGTTAKAEQQLDRLLDNNRPLYDALHEAVGKMDRDRLDLTPRAKRGAPAPALEAELRAQLKRYGIDDRIGLRLVDAIRDRDTGEVLINPDGSSPSGRYGRRIIEVALGSPDRMGTMNHEAIHGFRELGLFTQREWDALRNAADRDAKLMDEIRDKYRGERLTEEDLREEAVAELFKAWQAGRADAGPFREIFERIRDFLAAVAQAFRGHGFTTAESVFRSIDEGRIGGRPTHEIAAARYGDAYRRGDRFDLSATEQALADAILAEQPGLAERVKKAFTGNRSGLGSEAVRQLVNQFQPIFDAEMRAEKQATGKAQLRKARESAAKFTELAMDDRTGTLIEDGPLKFEDGGITFAKGIGGLGEIFRMKDPSPDAYKRFSLYAIARRTQGVTNRDRQDIAGWRRELAQVERQTETNEKALASIQNDPAMVQKRQKLEKAIADGKGMVRKLSDQIDDKNRRIRNLTGFMTDAQVKEALAMETPEFRKMFDGYQRFNKAMLDFAVDTGVVKPADRDAYASGMDYVPFYRVMEETGELPGPAAMRKLSNPDPKIRKLEGGDEKIGDVIENVIRNATSLARAGMRNEAMRRVHGVLQEIGEVKNLAAADEKAGSASYFDKGTKRHFIAEDPAMMAAIGGMRREQQDGLMRAMAGFSNILRKGVTAMPPFQAANLIRDTAGAYVQTGKTMSLANNAITGMVHAAKNDATIRELKAATGLGSYDFGHGHVNVGRKLREHIGAESPYKWIVNRPWEILDKVVAPFEKVGAWTELANRDALYRTLTKEGEDSFEAAYQAKNLLNFSRRGANRTLQNWLPLIPFLNARIQGLYRMAETQGNPKALKGVLARGLLLTGVSAALAAAFGDDEALKDATLEDRLNYYLIPLPDGKIAYIPKPFEFGALFSTMPEFLFDAIRKKDGDDLAKATAMTFLNTFSFNPIPQAVKPALEAWTNYDFFSGRPIESANDRRVKPGERANARTSDALKALGRETNISPLQAEHMIRGYLGTLGQMTLAGMDAIMRAAGAAPSKPTGAFGSVPVVSTAAESVFGRFYRDRADVANRWVGDFYDLKHQADEAFNTVRRLRQEGEAERAKDVRKENFALLSARRQLDKLAKPLQKTTQLINDVRADDDLTPEEKRARINVLSARRNAIARKAEAVLERMKGIEAKAAERDAA